MGALLTICGGAQLAACCGSAACTMCCSVCNSCSSCRNSTATRVMYAIMLLFGTLVSCIMLAPGLQTLLKKVPFCSNSTSFLQQSYFPDCQKYVGYVAVYRLCFALCMFFLVMALITIGVKSSKDARAPIQNGFWGIKYMIVAAGVVAAFFIPDGSFGTVWMYFGMVGAFVFIIVQLILIVDFAHSWAESWVSKYEQTESKKWYAALLTAMMLLYAITIISYIFLFMRYTKSNDCGLNKFFITSNIIFSVIASGVSILPNVQEAQPKSGLLQSSIVSLYVTYLTWSALSNSPDTKCNPGLFSTRTDNHNNQDPVYFDTGNVIGLVLWMACVLYSSLRTASSSSKIVGSDKMLVHETGAESDATEESGRVGSDGNRIWDNEEDEVAYSWSFFHVMFAFATLHVMMTLTNWYTPNSTYVINEVHHGSGSMWVKQVSSWLCLGLYSWTLIAPLILTDRDFS